MSFAGILVYHTIAYDASNGLDVLCLSDLEVISDEEKSVDSPGTGKSK